MAELDDDDDDVGSGNSQDDDEQPDKWAVLVGIANYHRKKHDLLYPDL